MLRKTSPRQGDARTHFAIPSKAGGSSGHGIDPQEIDPIGSGTAERMMDNFLGQGRRFEIGIIGLLGVGT